MQQGKDGVTLLGAYEVDVLRTENTAVADPLAWGAMKLTEEAGEACGVVAKHVGQGHPLERLHLLEELGDTLYALTYTGLKAGFTLDQIIRHNMKKREVLYPEGFDTDRSLNR